MEDLQEDGYQIQSPFAGVILQVLPEIKAAHILVDKTERVWFSRVDPYEWYLTYVRVLKEAAYADLVVEPLCYISCLFLRGDSVRGVPWRRLQYRMSRSDDRTLR